MLVRSLVCLAVPHIQIDLVANDLQGMLLSAALDIVRALIVFFDNQVVVSNLVLPLIVPYGNHWMMHCGMEIILPDGELIRTGMGALPEPSSDKGIRPDEQKGNCCWQLFNYGFGPYNDGIFTQSSLGIVVEMGIWVCSSQLWFGPATVLTGLFS